LVALTKDHPKDFDHCHYLVLGERLYQLLHGERNNQQKCFNITQVLDRTQYDSTNDIAVAKELMKSLFISYCLSL
jgi:hypothetical protein